MKFQKPFLILFIFILFTPHTYSQDEYDEETNSIEEVYSEEESHIEEVIVTAQRREQNLQDVPISVTAFTTEDLELGNIKSAADYLSLTPNVSFTEDGSSGSRGVGISVRGVNNLVTGENAFVNSIGIYLDGFSVSSVPNQVANPFLPDMQRVEVLRGPQGTYFGRNSVGGALNLVSNEPTEQLEGKLTIGAESYENANEQYNVTGVLNLPVTDQFKLRGVVYFEDSGGLVNNICASGAPVSQCPGAVENGVSPNGAEDSGHDFIMTRLKGLWYLTDATTASFTVIYSEEDQASDENVPSGVLDLDTTDSFGISSAVDPGTGFWPDNRNLISHDLQESNQMKSLLGIINIEHAFSNSLTLKSITGFIDAEQIRFFDNDTVGGVDVLRRDNDYDGFSWSTELRLESIGERFDWVAGLMYAEDDQEQHNNVHVGTGAELGQTINGIGLFPPFPANLGLLLNDKNFEVQSIALFGDVTWYATNQLELIAGARYTHDTVLNELQANSANPTCVPGCAPPTFAFFNSFANAPRTPVSNDLEFNDISPRFSVRYQFTDDFSLYSTVSKGYKAGGTSVGNNSALAGAPPVATPFDEETLWNYEVGFKSQLLDRRLRVNASAFHLRWSDLQFESFRFLVPGNLDSNFEETINIEDAEATGFEIEFLALVSENITLSGGMGYLTTEITSDTTAQLTGGFVVNLQGLEIPKSPELTANLVGEYRWYLANNEAWVRLEYIHRDGQYSDIEGLTNAQTRGPSPNAGLVRTLTSEFPYLSPAYDLFNFRAGYEMDNYNLIFYVQNLTDEEYYTGTQENFGASGIRLKPHPRVFGASISYSF